MFRPPAALLLRSATLPFLALGLLLSGCATKPLSSVDLTKYRTASVDPAVKMPTRYEYTDITGQRARGVGGQFGLVGGLVGAAIAAGSEGAGRDRFDPVVRARPIDVRQTVQAHFVNTLNASKLFTLTPGNADVRFKLVVNSYGVTPQNEHQLGGMINAQATLVDRAGKQVWSRQQIGVSHTTAMLDAFVANPGLWPQVMDEAAENLARKLVLYTDSDRR
jgi:hypothetical protein